MNENNKRIWITWERQRRSQVLAKEFEAEYFELNSTKKSIGRYFELTLKTISVLQKSSPKIVFVQNPSIFLAVVASLYKVVKGNIFLVIDRHSNFFQITDSYIIFKLLQLLADFASRQADLTIVTNQHLQRLVESRGGKSIVLEDKIPELSTEHSYVLAGSFNLLYPCSFEIDEPIDKVLSAAEKIGDNVHIYISGNHKGRFQQHPENVHFLGFVSDSEYVDYLNSVDAVIALTDWEYTLLCCAYEAVSLCKPLVMSRRKELNEYFSKGCIYCDNSGESIAKAITLLNNDYEKYRKEIVELKRNLNDRWKQRFSSVKKLLSVSVS